MNHYVMIRRLRGPAFLLLVGTLALLNQANILSWGKSWPFFLILAGVLALAERMALSSAGGVQPRPGQSYPGQPFPGQPQPSAPDPRASTGVPAYPGRPIAQIADPRKKDEGGQL
jgi:hypothetical protein